MRNFLLEKIYLTCLLIFYIITSIIGKRTKEKKKKMSLNAVCLIILIIFNYFVKNRSLPFILVNEKYILYTIYKKRITLQLIVPHFQHFVLIFASPLFVLYPVLNALTQVKVHHLFQVWEVKV